MNITKIKRGSESGFLSPLLRCLFNSWIWCTELPIYNNKIYIPLFCHIYSFFILASEWHLWLFEWRKYFIHKTAFCGHPSLYLAICGYKVLAFDLMSSITGRQWPRKIGSFVWISPWIIKRILIHVLRTLGEYLSKYGLGIIFESFVDLQHWF